MPGAPPPPDQPGRRGAAQGGWRARAAARTPPAGAGYTGPERRRARPGFEAAVLTPRRIGGTLLLALGFVLYLSLWPFRWQGPDPGTELWPLVRDRLLGARPGGRGDVLANLLLYLVPALLLGAMLPRRWPRPVRAVLPALAMGAISLGVEVAQVFLPGRVASWVDVIANFLGALAGAGLAVTIEERRLQQAVGLPFRLADPYAAALLLTWLLGRFYPYVPVIDLQAWKDNLKPLLLDPHWDPLRTATLLVGWSCAALLTERAFPRRRLALLVPAGLLAAVIAEVVIPGKALTLAEMLAIGGAVLAWALLRGRRAAPAAMALAMLFALVVERLSPFAFAGPPRDFGLIPFASIVGGSFGIAAQSVLYKLFVNGALLFWACRAGLAWRLAAPLQVLLVLALSIAQCWLPDRSAEITDPLLALGLAIAFRLLQPDPGAACGPAGGGDARRMSVDGDAEMRAA